MIEQSLKTENRQTQTKTGRIEDLLLPPPSSGVNAEVKSEIGNYQKQIGELKSLGVPLNINRSLCLDSKGLSTEESLAYINKINNYNYTNLKGQNSTGSLLEGSPLENLTAKTAPLLAKSSDLTDNNQTNQQPESNKGVTLNPYSMKISNQKGETRVQVFDYLNKDKPLIFDNKGPGSVERAADFYFKNIGDNISTSNKENVPLTEQNPGDQKLLEKINQIPAVPCEQTLTTVKDHSLSAPELDSVKQMLGKYRLSFSVYPKDREANSVGENSFLSQMSGEIPFEPKAWERSGTPPVHVNGQVQTMLLSRQLPADEIAQLSPEEKENLKKKPIIEEATDQYGNSLVKSISCGSLDKNGDISSVSEEIGIAPHKNFVRDSKDTSTAAPINFDASALKGPSITGFISQDPLKPFAKVGNYGFYSNMTDSSNLKGLTLPAMRSLTKGVENAEELFGQKSGSRVNNLLVVRSDASNAYFRRSDPSTIGILDDITGLGKSALSKVATHETTHLIDSEFKDKLSGGAMEQTWKELKDRNAPFLSEICESKFDGTVKNGGHASDASAELLSSTVVSLTHPHWKHRVKELGGDFQKDYLKVLKAFQSNVESIPEIPPDAPIRKLLEKRIKDLNSI